MSDEKEEEIASFEERYFVFAENRLIYFNEEGDDKERGVLQIRYSRMKKTSLRDSN